MRRKILSSLLLVIFVATGAWAQQQQFIQQQPLAPAAHAPFFFQPNYIKQGFFRPMTFQLSPPGTLRDQVQDGKLSLSLADVVRLVVARNTDVWIARMSLQTQANNVLSAYGTFDPSFTAGYTFSQSASQVGNVASDASKSVSQSIDSGYSQTFKTGSLVSVSFGNSRNLSNNIYQTGNPQLKSNFGLSVTQPLLRNSGIFQNTVSIIQAKIRQQSGRRTFEQSLTSTLVQAMSQYWAAVRTREALKIAQDAFDVAQKIFDRDNRKLELGALPVLDLPQSRANLERSSLSVVTARYGLQQAEDQLRKTIAADLDPETRDLPLNLTEDPFPSRLLDVDVQDQIAKAFAYRPDVDITKRNQALDDISVRTAMNGLKPSLGLTAGYSLSGLGGETHDRDTGEFLYESSLLDTWGILGRRRNPTYKVTLNLTLPIRDRARSATLANSLITQRTGFLTERNQAQQITLDVKNAVSNLEQQKASMQVSKATLDASKAYAEAAQKKFELGVNTLLDLLTAQNGLASDKLNYMNTAIAYRNAVVTLQQVTGLLLQENNVVFEDAARLTQTATVKQIIDQPGTATPPPAAKKD